MPPPFGVNSLFAITLRGSIAAICQNLRNAPVCSYPGQSPNHPGRCRIGMSHWMANAKMRTSEVTNGAVPLFGGFDIVYCRFVSKLLIGSRQRAVCKFAAQAMVR